MRGEMPAGSYGAACASRLYGRGYGRSFGRGEFVRFYETTQVQHREYRWTIVNSFIDLIPAISQDPARTAVVEALPGDNIASIAASAAAAAVEADWACSGGGGQHAAAPNAPPYQGHRFDTKGPVYKDPAVVELLRTKYADKMEEAVSRDRAKRVDNLNLKRTAWTREDVFRTIFIWQDEQAAKVHESEYQLRQHKFQQKSGELYLKRIVYLMLKSSERQAAKTGRCQWAWRIIHFVICPAKARMKAAMLAMRLPQDPQPLWALCTVFEPGVSGAMGERHQILTLRLPKVRHPHSYKFPPGTYKIRRSSGGKLSVLQRRDRTDPRGDWVWEIDPAVWIRRRERRDTASHCGHQALGDGVRSRCLHLPQVSTARFRCNWTVRVRVGRKKNLSCSRRPPAVLIRIGQKELYPARSARRRTICFL